jgi:hypothetical protein
MDEDPRHPAFVPETNTGVLGTPHGATTMTFLEFVLYRYVGAPRGNYWTCPWCEHPNPSLVVNEPLEDHAIKFRCHRCQKWGDEFDVLEWFGVRPFDARRTVLNQLRREWEEAEREDTHQHTDTTGGTRRTPSSPPKGRFERERMFAIGLAWNDLMDRYRAEGIDRDEAYELFAASDEARERPELLEYWDDFRAWIKKTTDAHMMECRDPECDTYCCRALRGLPPLTREEIAQQVEAEKARLREMSERIGKQVREQIARMLAEKRRKR